MNMKKIYLYLVFLFLSISLGAQESELGNWMIYFGNVQMNERFNWHNEIQYRNYNAVGDLEQLLIRTGFGYNLTENNNNILLGYGYILSENYLDSNDAKESISEHRIYQQFITRQKIGRVGLQHRYRFEQRFIEDDFKLRFRYFLGLNIPLNKAQMEDNTLYASLYNELFINTSGVLFDRDRIYGGLGYKVSPKLRFELAYMTQVFTGSSRDQVNIVCFLNL